MGHWVYIIQSESTGRHYCGQTRDVSARVAQHNDPINDLSKTTKRFHGPWKLVWSEQVASGSEVVRHERKIKRRGIARFLEGRSCSRPPANAKASNWSRAVRNTV
jgi:putative endonuclease